MYSTNSVGPLYRPLRDSADDGNPVGVIFLHYFSLLLREQEGSYPVQNFASDFISEDSFYKSTMRDQSKAFWKSVTLKYSWTTNNEAIVRKSKA